jgi:hypothetical protein
MEEEKPVEIWEMIRVSYNPIIMPENIAISWKNEYESRRSGDVLLLVQILFCRQIID